MASLQDDPPHAEVEDAVPGETNMFAARRARLRAAKSTPEARPDAPAPADVTSVPSVGTPAASPPASTPVAQDQVAEAPVAQAPVARTQAADSPPASAATDVASLYSEYAVADEPATDEPAAAPAAVTPSSTMDSILRAALAEKPQRVVPGRSAAPRASGITDDAEAEVDEAAAPGAHDPSDPSDDPLRPDMPEPDPAALDLVVYKGIENASQVFMALMKSGGLPDREAAQIWSDYLSYENSPEKRERIADLSARERMINEEEARLLKQEAATSATNGGALSSLFGSMMSAPSRRRKAIAAEALAKAKDALANDKVLSSNKFADEQRLRIYETKSRAYNERMAKLFASIDDAAASVRSYNDAFIDAPEASGFKEAAARWAAQSGSGLPDVMREVAEGRAPESVMAEFYAVRERALANEDVMAAHRRILANESLVRDGFSEAIKEGERMTRAFPDRFDHDKQFDGLTRAMDGSFLNSPRPMTEPPGPDMAERFKEMAESMQRSFAAMFETLASIFSRG